ncbi:MAG: hypothetical protein IKF83_00985 [Clostridia bacterium]|nr:hypothetical protein [Clostridia bacterium]
MDKVYEWAKPDWSKLEASFPRGGDFFVGEQDMEQFIADAFLAAELETGITMDEFVKVNMDFYEAKEELFNSIYCLEAENSRLLAVEELLRVPVKA